MFTETDMLLCVVCCLPAVRHLMFSWNQYGAGGESSLGSWIQRSGPSADPRMEECHIMRPCGRQVMYSKTES